MGFDEILDAWEKQQARKPSESQQDMEELISRYPPKDPKDSDRREEGKIPAQKKPRRPPSQQVEPQAVLDLHGLKSHEAEQALETFVNQARRRGLQHVLIVHGKGHHSPGEPVLLGVVRRYLEKCPYTGAFGPAGRKHGGRGATWVTVREARR